MYSKECVVAQFLPQTQQILHSLVTVLLLTLWGRVREQGTMGLLQGSWKFLDALLQLLIRADCGPELCFHPLPQHGKGHSGSAVSRFLSFAAAYSATKHSHPQLSHSSAAFAPLFPIRLSFISATAAMRCLVPVSPTEQAG